MQKAGYKLGDDIALALDVAASEFYDKKTKQYRLKGEGKRLEAGALVEMYAKMCAKYPIVSIEWTAMAEDDWSGWKTLTDKLGGKTMLVGDDIFVTNTKRFKRGIDEGIANAILVKVNQIGTLSETVETVRLAGAAGYKAIMSHRSGETEDTTIADLAVGLETGFITTGSASRTDRVAKYNQLLRIEEELGSAARYPGRAALRR